MGTVNVLDIAFKRDLIKAIVVVTTDKVYRNDNSGRAFVETDPLEGKDPYSASKVGTESVVAAWQQIAKVQGGPKVASVRAGNVIGGGDFAANRLIPDLVRSAMIGKPVEIRNPNSTRPWQHVLDPLKGYILTLDALLSGNDVGALNLGPNEKAQLRVEDVVKIFVSEYQSVNNVEFRVNFSGDLSSKDLETEYLALDSSLSLVELNWLSTWSPEIAVHRTSRWWRQVISGTRKPSEEIAKDITDFLKC
jgi:CDP-glucose 4,6-dehydratase